MGFPVPLSAEVIKETKTKKHRILNSFKTLLNLDWPAEAGTTRKPNCCHEIKSLSKVTRTQWGER